MVLAILTTRGHETKAGGGPSRWTHTRERIARGENLSGDDRVRARTHGPVRESAAAVYVCYADLPFTDLLTSFRAPYVFLPGNFAGISTAGWMLLATMALSFLQWYFIGWIAQKLWRRLTNDPSSAPS